MERMIQLAEDFFGTRNDSTQISVNEEVLNRLRQIHSHTLNEKRNDDGPVAWILIVPTTAELMKRFIDGKINESELLSMTSIGVAYETIYLCSALVLPEFRGKGIAKQLTIEAVERIRKDHSIQSLFVWQFSSEGEKLADTVAKAVELPLYKRG